MVFLSKNMPTKGSVLISHVCSAGLPQKYRLQEILSGIFSCESERENENRKMLLLFLWREFNMVFLNFVTGDLGQRAFCSGPDGSWY